MITPCLGRYPRTRSDSLWRGAFPRTHRRQRAMAACTRSRRVPPRAPFGITLHVLHAHAEIRTLSIILVASASTCCSVHTARLYSIKPYTRVRAAREVENVRGRSSSLLLQTRVRIVRARAVRGPTFKVALLLASFPACLCTCETPCGRSSGMSFICAWL